MRNHRVFALGLVACCALIGCTDKETDGLESGASPGGESAAGSGGAGQAPGGQGDAGKSAHPAGAGASGKAPGLAPKAGEYELVHQMSYPLGSYAYNASVASVHLSLRENNGALEAHLSVPYGNTSSSTVTVDPTQSFVLPENSGQGLFTFTPSGPLHLTKVGVELGPDSLSDIAFDLDSQGNPTRATARGFHAPPGLLCTQNASGDAFLDVYAVTPDQTAPQVKGNTNLLPWGAKLRLSELVTVGTPQVTGATLTSLTQADLSLTPTFSGGLFALLGQTVQFHFDALVDAAGNTGTSAATLAFQAASPAAAAFDYSDLPPSNSPCSGKDIDSLGLLRLTHPGATKATLSLCAAFKSANLSVLAVADDGSEQLLPASIPEGTSQFTVDLPASDVVLQLSRQGCSSSPILVTRIDAQ